MYIQCALDSFEFHYIQDIFCYKGIFDCQTSGTVTITDV